MTNEEAKKARAALMAKARELVGDEALKKLEGAGFAIAARQQLEDLIKGQLEERVRLTDCVKAAENTEGVRVVRVSLIAIDDRVELTITAPGSLIVNESDLAETIALHLGSFVGAASVVGKIIARSARMKMAAELEAVDLETKPAREQRGRFRSLAAGLHIDGLRHLATALQRGSFDDASGLFGAAHRDDVQCTILRELWLHATDADAREAVFAELHERTKSLQAPTGALVGVDRGKLEQAKKARTWADLSPEERTRLEAIVQEEKAADSRAMAIASREHLERAQKLAREERGGGRGAYIAIAKGSELHATAAQVNAYGGGGCSSTPLAVGGPAPLEVPGGRVDPIAEINRQAQALDDEQAARAGRQHDDVLARREVRRRERIQATPVEHLERDLASIDKAIADGSLKQKAGPLLFESIVKEADEIRAELQQRATRPE